MDGYRFTSFILAILPKKSTHYNIEYATGNRTPPPPSCIAHFNTEFFLPPRSLTGRIKSRQSLQPHTPEKENA